MKNLSLSFLAIAKRIVLLSFILYSSSLIAEQKVVQGNYQVHYSVFPSTVITPELARSYQIKRSSNSAVINITPQQMLGNSFIGTKAHVSGKARNLIGNTKQLTFTEFVEGDVIYYLASLSFSHEEHYRFDIEVSPHLDSNTTKSTPTLLTIEFDKKFSK